MKKMYMRPTMEKVELHPHSIMLNGSFDWPEEDTAGFNNDYEDDSHFY